MIIAGFYRSPSSKSEQFIDILENTLDKLDNLICFGDTNYDLLKTNDPHVQNYIGTLKNNNYSILNSQDRNSFTYSENKIDKPHVRLLDHSFSDKFKDSSGIKIDIHDLCFSDHRALFFKRDLRIRNNESTNPLTYYDFDKINEDLLNLDTGSLDITDFLKKFF